MIEMNWFVKGAALAGFAVFIAGMVAVYMDIEQEVAPIRVDRVPSQGAPESWTLSRYDISSNTTETEYKVNYDGCALYVSKDSTGAWTESVMTVMECSREVRTANPDYGGPDFAAVWEDMGSCGMSLYEVAEGTDGDVGRVFIAMLCHED